MANQKTANKTPLTKTAKQKSSKSSPKILLVEKSKLIRTVVKDKIKSKGITNIIEATNSSDALKIAKQKKPDIVCVSYLIYEIENNNIFHDINSICPNSKLAILSSTPKKLINSEIMKKYKIGYIPKCSDYETLTKLIQK